jgi:membrane fusion protein (multidrug efflux system)
MFARVRLITRDAKDALALPEQALVPQGDQQFVYRIVDGKAVRTKVDVGQRRDAMVEVLNGVDKDDVVVTAGQLKLRDGVTVTVAGADVAKSPATAASPVPVPPATGLGAGASAFSPAEAAPAKAENARPTPRKS